MMNYISFLWILALPLHWGSPFFGSHPATFSDPAPYTISHIVGSWYLTEQEVLINGKGIEKHFEDLAVHLSAENSQSIDPYLLADRFKKGYKGIPEGTKLELRDDYSYSIIIAEQQEQQGYWQLKKGQTLLLQSGQEQIKLNIMALDSTLAVFSIREENMDSGLNAGRHAVMELILNFSR